MSSRFIDSNQQVRLIGALSESGTQTFDTLNVTNSVTTATLVTTAHTPATTSAWVSGTGKLIDSAADRFLVLEVVSDGTNNVASCVVAISVDAGMNYTTLATPGTSAPVDNLGAVTLYCGVHVPAGALVKLTLTHVTVAASVYY
jgi:microcompartment protein CcmK/EutM